MFVNTLKENVAVLMSESVSTNETGYVPTLSTNGVIVITTEVSVVTINVTKEGLVNAGTIV